VARGHVLFPVHDATAVPPRTGPGLPLGWAPSTYAGWGAPPCRRKLFLRPLTRGPASRWRNSAATVGTSHHGSAGHPWLGLVGCGNRSRGSATRFNAVNPAADWVPNFRLSGQFTL
jgi:hypothetical protein